MSFWSFLLGEKPADPVVGEKFYLWKNPFWIGTVLAIKDGWVQYDVGGLVLSSATIEQWHRWHRRIPKDTA